LDEAYYKKETSKEKEPPVKIVQTNMEKMAFKFRLQKNGGMNKSQLNNNLFSSGHEDDSLTPKTPNMR
jgi:hypothetical protein